MGFIPKRVPWTRQPPQNTPIDWGNPLTRGLRLCVLGGSPENLVGASPATFSELENPVGGDQLWERSPDWQWFNKGTTWYVTRANYNAFDTGEIQPRNTKLCYYNPSHASDERVVASFIIGMNSNGATGYIEHTSSSGAIRYGGSDGSWRSGFANTVVPAYKWVAVAARYDNETMSLWIDGNLDDEITNLSGDLTGDGTVHIGATPSTQAYVDARIALSLVWNRDLSDVEMKMVGENPWQLFQPRTQWLPAGVAGGAEPHSASGGGTIEPLEAAGTAKVRKAASGAANVPMLEAAGTAKIHSKASGAASLESLVASGAAKVHSKASGDVSLPVLSASGSTKVIKPASGAASLEPLESSGTAKVHSKASGDVSLPVLEASGVASVIHSASGSVTLPALSASGAAEIPGDNPTASGAAILPTLESSGTAKARRSSSGSAIIPMLQAAGTAVVRKKASGDVSLPALTASGTANGEENSASGAANIPMLLAAGTAVVRRRASGNPSLPALIGAGVASVGQKAFGAAIMPSLMGSGGSRRLVQATGVSFLPGLTADGNVIVGGVTIVASVDLEAYIIEQNLEAQIIVHHLDGKK